MKIRGKKCEGFTLLEVMIASVMGAFIALVALSSLRMVTAAKELVSKNSSVSDELTFAARRIRTDLANLYRDSDINSVKFVGTIEQDASGPVKNIVFRTVSMTKARAAAIESDVYEVQYFLRRDGEGSVLARRYCPIVGVESQQESLGGILTIIAEDITGFDLLYFDGSSWYDEWPETERELPQLVRITIAAGADDGDETGKNLMAKSFLVSFPRMPVPVNSGNDG